MPAPRARPGCEEEQECPPLFVPAGRTLKSLKWHVTTELTFVLFITMKSKDQVVVSQLASMNLLTMV